MTENRLFPFPDKDACATIYKKDPCYPKIPECDRKTVFENAWETGIREAKCFLDEIGPEGLSMYSVLVRQGYSVRAEDTDYVMGMTRYFCELYPADNSVVIYRKSVQLWADEQGLSYGLAKNIILAHEYFHHLEVRKIGWVSRQYLVPMLKIGRLSIGKTGIAALSEVAANAFANEYYRRCVELNITDFD